MIPADGKVILRHIRRLASKQGTTPPDSELIQRFLETRDESAFASLIDRYGGMVLGVCRTVLRHRQDAEDAFQATFLVLAGKAGSIRKRDSLGSWLHGVAYRVARKAKAAAARRQELEKRAALPADASNVDDLSWGEVRAILHTELAALPERLRAPLVLCHLGGLTQEQAARRLGWTAATVKGRLQRGRDLLRRRLERRGLGLSAVIGAVSLAGDGLSASVPVPLAQATVQAACSSAGGVTAAVTALISHAMRPVIPLKYKMFGIVLLTASLVAGSVMHRQEQTEAEGATEVKNPARQTAAPPMADLYGDPLPKGAVARLGTLRFNHGERLNSAFFSPDGKKIISEGGGFIRIWDAADGKELQYFTTAPTSFDDQTTLSPDGKTITLLNQEVDADTARVWDLTQGKETSVLPLPFRRSETSVHRRNALSPDGRLCACHTPELVRVFETASGKELYQIATARDEITGVAFAGNRRLVTADKKRLITVRDARSGRTVREFPHGWPVVVLAASCDGRRLATLEHHNYAIDRWLDKDVVRLWDPTTGKLLHTLPARPKRWYMRMLFSPDGTRLFTYASGEKGGELTVWNADTGQRLRDIDGNYPLALSPHGRRLAANLFKFQLYDVESGQCLSTGESTAPAPVVSLSRTGEHAAIVGYSAISTWDGNTGRRLSSFNVPVLYHPAAGRSPDDRFAVTYDGFPENAKLIIWDVASQKRLQTLAAPRANYWLCYAFSPDASLLATCQHGKPSDIRIWHIQTGKEVRSFKDPRMDWPGLICFTEEGRALVVAGKHVTGYEVSSGKELFSWRMKRLAEVQGRMAQMVKGKLVEVENEGRPWRSLAFSPDGSVAATIIDGGWSGHPIRDRIALWNGRTGKLLRRWSDSGKMSPSYEQIVFSHDGRLLATSDGRAVHVWETATGGELCTLHEHRGEIGSVCFSGNDRRLATASNDRTALIWDLARVSGATRRNQTADNKQLAVWWADLAGTDAARAYSAIWRLTAVPEQSVPFLRERLKPITPADVKSVSKYIRDLGSESFAVRDQACRELERLGDIAEAALRQELSKDPPLEIRRRIERMLSAVEKGALSAESLRILRALTVLEQAATPEAHQVLRTLAAGAPGVWLTREAGSAWRRIEGGRGAGK